MMEMETLLDAEESLTAMQIGDARNTVICS